jgi:hypothetical protein
MAWFDILGGIAGGLQSGSQAGLAAIQQKKAEARQAFLDKQAQEDRQRRITEENRQRAMEDLVLRGSDLSDQDVKNFVAQGVPASSFVKTDTGWGLRKTIGQQAQEIQAQHTLDQDTAKKNIDKLRKAGQWSGLSLDEKTRMITEAGIDVNTPGLFNPAETQQVAHTIVKNQAAEILTTLRIDAARAAAEARAAGQVAAAESRANNAVALAKLENDLKSGQKDRELRATTAVAILKTGVTNDPQEALRQAQQMLGGAPTPGVRRFNPQTGQLE